MEPSEVRSRVLDDHQKLRADLVHLEDLVRAARREAAERADVEALRRTAEALLARLEQHMRWEERYLLPVLREADAWGEQRADQLLCDHHAQRHELAFVLERLRDPSRPHVLVVNDLVGLIAFLREDMEEEERDMLDERVLRDDVVGIDVETG